MSLEAVIETARLQLGISEDPPGSNRVKYWEDYGPGWQGQPWCVCFLWWCFRAAGEEKAFFGGARTASCGTLLRWYEAQGHTVPAEGAQPGDIVILNLSGKKGRDGKPDTEHCGLVTAREDTPSLRFRTIEGNTSPGEEGSQDNGGSVASKVRYPRQIVGVCRPKYKQEVVIVDDIKGHWAEAEIRRCIRRGLIKGYPDGTFAPEKPVTRAELAVVMDRLAELLIGEGK